MLRPLIGAALLTFGALPAAASGNLMCSVEDESFTINLEGIFSHGLGEALTEAKGEIEIKADVGPLAKGLAGKPIVLADVKQFWMRGQELKVRLYRDAEGDAKEAWRNRDDEDPADMLGNAGDEVREQLGNLGDDVRDTADDATDDEPHA